MERPHERRRLPPLNALRAFEAAARHLNFSRAADELSVTPGAVSQQIQNLEDYVGAALFKRTPKGLLLTDAAQTALVRTYAAWSRVRRDDAYAYARKVLVNHVTDRWRRKLREYPAGELPDRAASPDPAD